MSSAAFTRRHAITGAIAAAGAATLPPLPGAAARQKAPLYRGGRFLSGVGSGDPARRRLLIWTRIHDVGRTGRVRWEVARDREFARVVAAGETRTSAAQGYTVRADVRSRQLAPGEEYFYRFHTRTADSPVGRARTLRPPDSREPVRIAVYSCQDYESGFYAAHRALAAERDLDLVVCVGDYIYERAAAGGVRPDRTGANADGDVQTLDEYRTKYRLYQADPDLQAMHAAHPHLAFWDSHDVEPLGSDTETRDQYGAQRRVPHSTRLAAGMRAFLEAMPQRFPTRAAPAKLYRSLRLGALADLVLTDETLYHDPYPCAFAFPPPECPEAENPARTYLGAPQKAWLKETLRASPATWKLYAGGTMMMGFELSRGRPFNTGQWDGYRAEREELCRHILDRGVSDVVRLSGDIHTFFAGQVTTTGRSDSTPALVEFIGGSISSLGIPEGFAAATGGDPQAIAAITEQSRTTNPHIAYTEQRHRGYKLIEARPDELLVTFRAPRDAMQPRSEVFDLQRFRVARGTPAVELL